MTITASFSTSLDGFIADPNGNVGPLFDWYQNGDVECPTASPDITMHISPKSVEHWRTWVSSIGALVCGRYGPRQGHGQFVFQNFFSHGHRHNRSSSGLRQNGRDRS